MLELLPLLSCSFMCFLEFFRFSLQKKNNTIPRTRMYVDYTEDLECENVLGGGGGGRVTSGCVPLVPHIS